MKNVPIIRAATECVEAITFKSTTIGPASQNAVLGYICSFISSIKSIAMNDKLREKEEEKISIT